MLGILGRCVVGGFPCLGTSRGDGQRPSATNAEFASVWPPSPRNLVPLPSATALGLGIHTAFDMPTDHRELARTDPDSTGSASSDVQPAVAFCSHARSSMEVMLKCVHLDKIPWHVCIYMHFPANASRCRFPCRSIVSDPKTNNCDRIL